MHQRLGGDGQRRFRGAEKRQQQQQDDDGPDREKVDFAHWPAWATTWSSSDQRLGQRVAAQEAVADAAGQHEGDAAVLDLLVARHVPSSRPASHARLPGSRMGRPMAARWRSSRSASAVRRQPQASPTAGRP